MQISTINDDMGLSGKDMRKMTVITSSINAHVYIKILDTFPTPKMFGGDDVFQDNQGQKSRKLFLKISI